MERRFLADDVAVDVLDDCRSKSRFEIEINAVRVFEQPCVKENAAFRVEEERLAPIAVGELLDVVGAQVVEQFRRVRSGDEDSAATRKVGDTDGGLKFGKVFDRAVAHVSLLR